MRRVCPYDIDDYEIPGDCIWALGEDLHLIKYEDGWSYILTLGAFECYCERRGIVNLTYFDVDTGKTSEEVPIPDRHRPLEDTKVDDPDPISSPGAEQDPDSNSKAIALASEYPGPTRRVAPGVDGLHVRTYGRTVNPSRSYSDGSGFTHVGPSLGDLYENWTPVMDIPRLTGFEANAHYALAFEKVRRRLDEPG